MADVLTAEQRKLNMSRIRGKNTTPELVTRRLLHAMGYRFRLHRKDLPGKPDIVLPGRKAVVFVHGCFWHRHPGCRYATTPRTRTEFWEEKFRRNTERDATALAALTSAGWQVTIIWECELQNMVALQDRLRDELERRNKDSDAQDD